ncbi:MAG: hypothetical protein HPY60_05270 [Candidatus Methanofastidiosum sp.]|nr:hypothetical protein [Methanofastidiosum sp.]
MVNEKGIEYISKNDLFYNKHVLVADIGGTNATIGICGISENIPYLLFYKRYNSKKINSIISPMKEILKFGKENHDIEINVSCFGCAGVNFKENIINLTNLNWKIDINEIKKETGLGIVHIINDFQAIGYGINYLTKYRPEDILIIKPGVNEKNIEKTKAIIGAGTGLGKSILYFNSHKCIYESLPSEGGHSDFPIKDIFEFELINYVKEKKNLEVPVRYEDILSGQGIESIYSFLKNTRNYEKTKYDEIIEKSNDRPSAISKYKNIDPKCRETFRLFSKFYGRCAKNFALDSLSLGGVYIAGGIAMKNKDILENKEFLDEFIDCQTQKEVLNSIPVYLIRDYNVSLYGAAFYSVVNSK